MDKPSASQAKSATRSSELDKFKLFFEISTTTQEERSRLKRQARNSSR